MDLRKEFTDFQHWIWKTNKINIPDECIDNYFSDRAVNSSALDETQAYNGQV